MDPFSLKQMSSTRKLLVMVGAGSTPGVNGVRRPTLGLQVNVQNLGTGQLVQIGKWRAQDLGQIPGRGEHKKTVESPKGRL